MPSLCSRLAQTTSFRAPISPSAADQEFRHEKERDAARAERRVGEARENQVDDVLREVVLAIGDEDLLAEETIGAVAARHGPRREPAEIGTRLRLRQVHGRGPLAGDHARQIERLQRFTPMPAQRLDRAHGQERAERERHAGAVPDLLHGGGEDERQPLPAEGFVGRDAVPAAGAPVRVGLAPAGGGRHRAVGELRTLAVADAVQRRKLVGGEAPSFAEHGIDDILAEVSEFAVGVRLRQPGDVLQREGDFRNRRAIHERLSPPLYTPTLDAPSRAGESRPCTISS